MDAERGTAFGWTVDCHSCGDALLLDANEAVAFAQMLTFTVAHLECPEASIAFTSPRSL